MPQCKFLGEKEEIANHALQALSDPSSSFLLCPAACPESLFLLSGLAEEEANSRRGNEGRSVVDGEVYSDGMEGLFDSGAELRFGRDKRMSEVRSC